MVRRRRTTISNLTMTFEPFASIYANESQVVRVNRQTITRGDAERGCDRKR